LVKSEGEVGRGCYQENESATVRAGHPLTRNGGQEGAKPGDSNSRSPVGVGEGGLKVVRDFPCYKDRASDKVTGPRVVETRQYYDRP